VTMGKLGVVVVLFFVQLGSVFCWAQTSSASSDFDKLVDETFDSFYKFHPTSGTSDGFHQYDTKLEDFSRASIDSEVSDLKQLLVKLRAFPKAGLPEDSVGDLEFLISRIQGRLLELETIQPWRKDPDSYTTAATSAIFYLMSRTFAPQPGRLRSVIARERAIPKLLDEAREISTTFPMSIPRSRWMIYPEQPGFSRTMFPRHFLR